jgi:hypothetical protein
LEIPRSPEGYRTRTGFETKSTGLPKDVEGADLEEMLDHEKAAHTHQISGLSELVKGDKGMINIDINDIRLEQARGGG